MTVTRAGGAIGIPGLYVTGDPGGVDANAKIGNLGIRIGLGWAKSHSFTTGQCPVMQYNRALMQAILYDKITGRQSSERDDDFARSSAARVMSISTKARRRSSSSIRTRWWLPLKGSIGAGGFLPSRPIPTVPDVLQSLHRNFLFLQKQRPPQMERLNQARNV